MDCENNKLFLFKSISKSVMKTSIAEINKVRVRND